jgi:hypothetical protein
MCMLSPKKYEFRDLCSTKGSSSKRMVWEKKSFVTVPLRCTTMKFEHTDFNNLKDSNPTQNQGTCRKAYTVFRCDVLGFFIHIVIVSTTFCFVLKKCANQGTLSYWFIIVLPGLADFGNTAVNTLYSLLDLTLGLSIRRCKNKYIFMEHWILNKCFYVCPLGAYRAKCQRIIFLFHRI